MTTLIKSFHLQFLGGSTFLILRLVSYPWPKSVYIRTEQICFLFLTTYTHPFIQHPTTLLLAIEDENRYYILYQWTYFTSITTPPHYSLNSYNQTLSVTSLFNFTDLFRSSWYPDSDVNFDYWYLSITIFRRGVNKGPHRKSTGLRPCLFIVK